MEYINKEGTLVSEKVDVIKMSIDLDMGLKEVLCIIGVSSDEKLEAELRYLLSEIDDSKDLKVVEKLLLSAQGTPLEIESLTKYKKLRDEYLRKRVAEVHISDDVKKAYAVYFDSFGTSVEPEAREVYERLRDIVLRRLLAEASFSGDIKEKLTVFKDSVGTLVETEAWEVLSEFYKK